MTSLAPFFARFAPALLLIAAVPALAHTDQRIDARGMASAWTELSWSETSIETAGDIQSADEYAVVEDDDRAAVSRFVDATGNFRPSSTPIASFGPFHVISADRVEMIGTVDSRTPAQFAAMMRRYPNLATMVMVECPGSIDERANHALARAVRAAGLDTVVPNGGSVRSGAVDLFLAGVHRRAAPGAEFGVHSWRDEDGLEADDFAANDPVHAEYINYYRSMGLSDETARRFYALTNSVSFEDVRVLSARQMAQMGLAELSPAAS
jgi:hypothetical protein